MLTKLLILSSLFLILAGVSAAQPQIQGPLSGTLGPGQFIVIGNCQVNNGDSLVILPGTTFLFSGPYSVTAYGRLMAAGSQDDSILFVRQFSTTACRHRGLIIRSPGCSLSYCWIDNAFGNQYGGAINVQDVNLTVSHCKITNCNATSVGGGIYADNADGSTISDCIFFTNSSLYAGALALYNCTNATVRNCLIAKNSGSS